jgi:hypothetical protein
LEKLKEQYNETQVILKNTQRKLDIATHQNKNLTDFANSYLGTMNTFAAGVKFLVYHFKPCFKGLVYVVFLFLIKSNFSKYPKLNIEKLEKVSNKLKTLKKSVVSADVLLHHKDPLQDLINKFSKLFSKITIIESRIQIRIIILR